jgi:hypothetical protein
MFLAPTRSDSRVLDSLATFKLSRKPKQKGLRWWGEYLLAHVIENMGISSLKPLGMAEFRSSKDAFRILRSLSSVFLCVDSILRQDGCWQLEAYSSSHNACGNNVPFQQVSKMFWS